MKTLLLVIALILPLVSMANQCESDYPPGVLTQGTKPNIHPGVNFVEPPYAGFDPCNKFIDLTINEKSDTFVVVLHGAGGMDNSQTRVGRRFQKAGFSVLMFDSFKMNKIDRDSMFWLTSVHNGSMGRMLYFSGLAAIKWLLKNHPERSKRIIVYGISTGGIAAANLAATSGLDALKIVFAEGPNNAGIGFPDQLLTPVHVFYGIQDNFGGATEDEFLWKRRSSCLWDSPNHNMPIGSSERCNYLTWKWGQRGQTVEEWVEAQSKKGAVISLKFVSGAAHGIFNGRDINSTVRASPSGIKIHMTTGSQPGVADKLFDEILALSR